MPLVRLLAATVSCLVLSVCLLWLMTASTSQDRYGATFRSSGEFFSSRLGSMLSFHTPSSLFIPAATISLMDDNSTFFAALSAAFGPSLPEQGLSGPLWIGDGFRDAGLTTEGLQPTAGGELGCGDVPGWHEEALNTSNDTSRDLPSQKPDEISGKIVLLSRGECGFDEKVKWAQRRGAAAVIVGDSLPGGPLVRMYAKASSNVSIPSVFTSFYTAHLLSSLIPEAIGPVHGGAGPKWPSDAAHGPSSHDGLWVTLTVSNMSISPFFNTFFVLVVSPLLTLVVVYVMLYIRSRIRRRRWRAPKSVVDRLPVRVYHAISTRSTPDLSAAQQDLEVEQSTPASPLLASSRHAEPESGRGELEAASAPASLQHMTQYGTIESASSTLDQLATTLPPRRRRYDGKQVECAVCLEEYEDGISKVMSLPCGHDFHADCITPWLVTKRRTCPICKGDVVRSMSDIEEPSSSTRVSTLLQPALLHPPLSLNERLMSEQIRESDSGDGVSDAGASTGSVRSSSNHRE